MVRVSVWTDIAIAVLLGGALAGGILCVLTAVPRWRAAALTTRIAPYVRDVVPDALIPRGILPRVGMQSIGGRTLWDRIRGAFEVAVGGGDALRVRLAQAGSALEPSSFRGRQLAWMLAGVAVGALAVIVLAVSGRMSAPTVLLPVLAGASTGIGYDMILTAKARARMTRLGDELPTTLEFLALCLSAGESLLDSVRRVAAVGSGASGGSGASLSRSSTARSLPAHASRAAYLAREIHRVAA